MRKDFYLFRHGETDYKREGRTQGCRIDVGLNDKGKAQALALAEKLCSVRLEKIFSSPLIRALQTAEAVDAYHHVGIEVIDDLREGCYGRIEGLTREEADALYPGMLDLWHGREMSDLRFEEGESRPEMAQRFHRAFEQMIAAPYRTVAVASHGGVMWAFLKTLGWHEEFIDNCSCYHLIYEDGRFWRE